jgi:glycosyltransferase involved in cell wall biosynthesis
MPNKPLFSIITIVFNAVNHVEKTIDSVFSQTYNNYEYIIIDGKSRDGTLEILNNYKDKFSTFISEPDSGVYDAMNKGLNHANGEYVFFLNAGDLLYDSKVLENIASIIQSKNPDVIYGDTVLTDQRGVEKNFRRLRPPKRLNWKKLKYGMLICHQSFFVKTSIVERYNLNYRFVADYDWMIRVLKNSRKNINSHIVISKFLEGGLSQKKRFQSLKERFNVMKKHYGRLTALTVHFLFVFRYLYSFFLQLLKKPYSYQ